MREGDHGYAVNGIDYDRGADAYRRGRTLPSGVLGIWCDALSSLSLPVGGRVLDVGSGTGQFLGPLAEWLDAVVIGVEPSAGMRDEARQVLVPRLTVCGAGRAEALPVRARSIDIAWLSAVVHQLENIDAAVDELRRVLGPGGCVLLRGYFADLPLGTLWRHFPGMERSAASFPTTSTVIDLFQQRGFQAEVVTPVREVWEFDLASWVSRARELRHVDSVLRPLTDGEFETGIASVTSHAEDHGAHVTNNVTLNLVMLRRE